MFVWLNGPFGVGKSTVAEQLMKAMPDAVQYDPGSLGQVFQRRSPDTADYQDIRE